MKPWETLAKCIDCGAEKVKRKDELHGEYRCIKCFRKKRGKELGSQFGKAQKQQGKCKNCGEAIATTVIYCKNGPCQEKKRLEFSKRMAGKNNPAWTGNYICKCGDKKSANADKCRTCSFESGNRSGENNGRYRHDREEYIAETVSASACRTTLSNLLKMTGERKSRKTEDILGYSFEEFRRHIENQFESWMNWKNRGSNVDDWQIDHIVPVSICIQNGIADPAIVNALFNLRPLKTSDNLKKSDNLTEEGQALLDQMRCMKKCP